MTKSVSNTIDVALATATPGLFHGAMIDAEGREIPITEQMIQQACHRLDGEASQFYPRQPGSGRPQTPQSGS